MVLKAKLAASARRVRGSAAGLPRRSSRRRSAAVTASSARCRWSSTPQASRSKSEMAARRPGRGARHAARGRARTRSRRRMDNTISTSSALVARLQRDTGANAAEVLDRVTETCVTASSCGASSRRSPRRPDVALDRHAAARRPARLVISLLNPRLPAPALSRLTGGRCSCASPRLMVMGGSL